MAVKTAFRRISMLVHPDKNQAEGASKAMQAVTGAFRSLYLEGSTASPGKRASSAPTAPPPEPEEPAEAPARASSARARQPPRPPSGPPRPASSRCAPAAAASVFEFICGWSARGWNEGKRAGRGEIMSHVVVLSYNAISCRGWWASRQPYRSASCSPVCLIIITQPHTRTQSHIHSIKRICTACQTDEQGVRIGCRYAFA